MAYVKINKDNSTVYPYNNLFKDNPNVSFPSPLDSDTLATFDVYEVHNTDIPEHNWDQDVNEGKPFFDGEKWVQTWSVVNADEEEIEKRIEKQKALLKEKKLELLAKSDWTQLPDSPANKEEWARYRQLIRDIDSGTSNFFNIKWPTPPEE